jgi:HD-like signal output (HDOD) protein
MRNVLFVDDEPQVLDALRDALRHKRRVWRMTFARSGPEALTELRRGDYDAVVSDMRMPGMDGAGLLTEVKHAQPETVRIVLSGSAETESLVRAAGIAHRFLSKPCQADEIVRVVERSCAADEQANEASLRRAAARTSVLPCTARIHEGLTTVFADGPATAAQAGAIIEQDMAMAAKVLQLVNSSFFGPSRRVTSLDEAVSLLGVEMLRALALSAQVFASFQPEAAIPGFDLDVLQRHSADVSRVARQLVTQPADRDAAFAVGLMHEIGLLVLAVHDPGYLGRLLTSADAQQRPLAEVERDERGLTHAALGADVLALWGLPDQIVDAVARHHEPLAVTDERLDLAGAVYVADALVREERRALSPGDVWLPSEPLSAALDTNDSLTTWRAIARSTVAPR